MAAMPRRAIATALSLLALAGCVSLGGGGKMPKFLLTLAADSPVAAGTQASGTAATTIVIAEPDTSQKLAVARIPVQVDDTKVAYLVDAAWVERPSRLFRNLIAETLRTRTTMLVLEDSQTAAPGGQRLGGQLVDMGYDARSQSVVVRFDALRAMPNGTVQSRRFESIVSGVQPKAEFVGPALNKAANDVARQVADWLVSS